MACDPHVAFKPKHLTFYDTPLPSSSCDHDAVSAGAVHPAGHPSHLDAVDVQHALGGGDIAEVDDVNQGPHGPARQQRRRELRLRTRPALHQALKLPIL